MGQRDAAAAIEEHDLTPWFEDDELLAEVLEPEEGKTDPDDVPEPPDRAHHQTR
jgi:hypothetical protein